MDKNNVLPKPLFEEGQTVYYYGFHCVVGEIFYDVEFDGTDWVAKRKYDLMNPDTGKMWHPEVNEHEISAVEISDHYDKEPLSDGKTSVEEKAVLTVRSVTKQLASLPDDQEAPVMYEYREMGLPEGRDISEIYVAIVLNWEVYAAECRQYNDGEEYVLLKLRRVIS